MAVTSDCDPDANAVNLNIRRGQKIRHRVDADPGVRFNLTDHTGRLLLVGSMPARTRLWPQAGDDTSVHPCTHTLGMVFGGVGGATWQVDIVNANEELISEIKHCTYTNDNSPDEFFAAIDIFVK